MEPNLSGAGASIQASQGSSPDKDLAREMITTASAITLETMRRDTLQELHVQLTKKLDASNKRLELLNAQLKSLRENGFGKK